MNPNFPSLRLLSLLTATFLPLGVPVPATAAPNPKKPPVATVRASPVPAVELAAFVRRYYTAAEANADPAAEGVLFADQVDYYGRGRVKRQVVVNDQRAYRRRWPVRRYRLEREPEQTRVSADGSVTVGYRLIYEAGNAAKVVAGSVEGEMRLRRARPGGDLQIVAIRETAP